MTLRRESKSPGTRALAVDPDGGAGNRDRRRFVTAWLAIVSNDGLAADDYYKQGLALNQRLQRTITRATGLRADVMRSSQQVRFAGRRRARCGIAGGADPQTVASDSRRQDQMVKMVSEGQGFYGGKLSADISGRWYVSIEDPAGRWRLQGEWQADGEAPLHSMRRGRKSRIHCSVTGRWLMAWELLVGAAISV